MDAQRLGVLLVITQDLVTELWPVHCIGITLIFLSSPVLLPKASNTPSFISFEFTRKK